MLVQLDGQGSLQTQLYRALRQAILQGRLGRGMRLPSSRALSSELQISRTTAVQVYEQLRAEGYLQGVHGSGTYVANELPDAHFLESEASESSSAKRTTPPRLSQFGRRLRGRPPSWSRDLERVFAYDFSYGRPNPADVPARILRRLVAKRMQTASPAALDYGPAAGMPELREVLAEYLSRARGVNTSPEQIVVVSGSQQGLDLTSRVLLDPGARVIVENLHYAGARAVFEAAGAELIGVPAEEEGMDSRRFPDAAQNASLVYVTPSHQFPTGAVMSLARRLALLEWAERTGSFIFEDDYDSEYRYTGRPIPALQGLDRAGRVVYAGTFSKLLYPSLRLGYLVVPEALVNQLIATKALTDTGCPALVQGVVADLIRNGHFERHLRRTRVRNGQKRATLEAAVGRHFGSGAELSGADSGLHVLLWLPDLRVSQGPALVERAAEKGVRVESVEIHSLVPPPCLGLLLGYTLIEEGRIEEGIRRLASVAASRG